MGALAILPVAGGLAAGPLTYFFTFRGSSPSTTEPRHPTPQVAVLWCVSAVTTVAIVLLLLVILGGLAEAAGIYLAFREVHERRAAITAYRTRPVTVFPESITSWANFGRGTITGGEPPTLEERLTALEQRVWPAIEEAKHEAVKRANARTASAVEATRSSAQQDTDELRGLLLRVTEPNWQVWTSLGLIVGGLSLQTVASALGVVAQS